MYVITANKDGMEVPIWFFNEPNDVVAGTRFIDEMEDYIQKASLYFFGQAPEDIALWNVTAESFCVTRKTMR